VNKLEVEQEDGCDPSVHGCVWLHIWVAKHALDILGIHFYNQVSNADNVNLECTEGTEEPIKLDLWL